MRAWRPVLLPLACLLPVAAGLAGCIPDPGASAGSAAEDTCDYGQPCDSPAAMSEQVRLDTEAMLAGIAHARERLGLQEDAAP